MKRIITVLLLLCFVCVSIFSYDVVVDGDYAEKGFVLSNGGSSFTVDGSIRTVRVMGCRIMKEGDGLWSLDSGHGLVYVALGASESVLGKIDGNKDLLLLISFDSSVDASFFESRAFDYVALQSFKPDVQTVLRKNGTSMIPVSFGTVVSVDGDVVTFLSAGRAAQQQTAEPEAEVSERILVVCPHCGKSFYISL